MHSIPQALTWQLWRRQGAAAAALLVYLAVLAATAHRPGAMDSRVTLFMACIPLAFGLVFLLSGFAYPEGDVLGPRSGFPRHMLTLPVRTAQLALWPMLHGSLTAALAWILPVRLILQPLDVPAPVWWPAAMLAAMLACLQALLWTPFGLPYARVLAALVCLPAMVTLGVNAALAGVSELHLAVGFTSMALAAYGMAVAGLSRGRRGDGEIEKWGNDGMRKPGNEEMGMRSSALPFSRFPISSFTGFRGAGAAQAWFEWRSTGMALPVVVGVTCILTSLPLLWIRDLTPIGMSVRGPTAGYGAFGGIEVNLWIKLQQASLLAPVLFAAILGCGRRRPGARHDLEPFLATRPLTETALVGARLRAAALSTAAAWGVMLLFATGWLLLPARDGERAGPLLGLLALHCPPTTVLAVVLILAVLMAWTWKSQVQGMFADLSGRSWAALGVPLVAHTLALAGFVWYGQWAWGNPLVDLRNRPLPAALPWLVGAAVLLKAGAAVVTASALRQRGLAQPGKIALWAGAWGTVTACLFGILWWTTTVGAASSPLARFLTDTYLPVGGEAVPDAVHAPGYLSAVAVLFVPFTRLLAAPLALAWNRHR